MLQRVSRAAVAVDGQELGQIGAGLLALVGVAPEDEAGTAERMLHKLLSCRVFADAGGRMNLDLHARCGGLLLVPNFTLLADCSRGNRPGFSGSAPPAHARMIFAHMCELGQRLAPQFACGRFGADMQVSLVNDGPVTLLLEL